MKLFYAKDQEILHDRMLHLKKHIINHHFSSLIKIEKQFS